MQTGLIDICRCFATGNEWGKPCYYWGRIELHRTFWTLNNEPRINDYYYVYLDFYDDKEAPYYMRYSAIHSNNGRDTLTPIRFKNLDAAKRFIRKHMNTNDRVKWIKDEPLN